MTRAQIAQVALAKMRGTARAQHLAGDLMLGSRLVTRPARRAVRRTRRKATRAALKAIKAKHGTRTPAHTPQRAVDVPPALYEAAENLRRAAESIQVPGSLSK